MVVAVDYDYDHVEADVCIQRIYKTRPSSDHPQHHILWRVTQRMVPIGWLAPITWEEMLLEGADGSEDRVEVAIKKEVID